MYYYKWNEVRFVDASDSVDSAEMMICFAIQTGNYSRIFFFCLLFLCEL